jgi:hypothetical protein
MNDYVTGLAPSGSNVATLFATGKYGNSANIYNYSNLVFNNVLYYSLTTPISAPPYTVSFWFKLNTNWVTVNANQPVPYFSSVIRAQNALYLNVRVASASSIGINYVAYDSTGANRSGSDTGSILDTTNWTFACFVVTSNLVTVYIQKDGSSQRTYTITPSVGATFNQSIGAIGTLFSGSPGSATGTTPPFDGLVDDLRVYNTALTAAQVQSVYSQGGAPASGFNLMPQPSLAWQFDGTTTDYVSGLSGKVVGTSPSYVSGKYGQAISITNTAGGTPTSNVSWTLPSISSTNFTVTCWVNASTLASSNGCQVVAMTGFNPESDVRIYFTSAGKITVQYPFASGVYIGSTSSSSYSTGTWVHVAASIVETSFSNTISVYINGSFVATSSSATGRPRSFTKLTIGSFCDGRFFSAYNGLVDDLRIYNTALSAAQVQSIYNAQGMPSRGVENSSYIKSASGGDTVQTINGYRIHTFTTVGTSTFTPATSGLVDVLVVAGGGGGGGCAANQTGGGGGAGELYYSEKYSVASGAITVTVGNGGNGGVGSTTTAATAGGNSVFGTLTCAGGGKGGDRAINGNAGGAGGSGGGAARLTGAGALGGASTATIGLGNKGGNTLATDANGAGGGGALGAGSNGDSSGTRPPGGPGASYSISGTIVSYGSGGVGGLRAGTSNGAGASANTGNGGGGGDGNATTTGGNGGSGIVIIRYPISIQMTNTPLFSQLSTAVTSSAVGAFSLRAVNGTTAKVVSIQSHPIVQWPPIAMTSNATVVSAQVYGNGTYYSTELSGQSNTGSLASFNAFDNNINTYYEQLYTGSNYYDYNLGTLLDTTKTTTVSGASAAGWWIQIQLPTTIVLRSYTLVGRQDGGFWNTRNPTTFWVAGSNDGTTWSNVHFQSQISYEQSGTTINVPSTSNSLAYSYYRLIVNVVGNAGVAGNHSTLNIASWNLNGDGPSYASGSATDFYADRLGNLLTAPVTGQTLANWLGGATGYVTTWYDQSGRGNHATQATAANQPVIQRATKGPGYSCLFNGTTNQMSFNSATGNIFDNTNFTACAVTRRRTAVYVPYQYFMGSSPPSSAAPSFKFGYTADTQVRFQFNNITGDAVNVTVPAYAGASEPTGYNIGAFSATSGMLSYAWRNGAQTSGTAPSGTILGTTSGPGTLGCSRSQQYFTGEMYEVLIFTMSLYDLDGTTSINQIYQNQLSYTGT